MSDTRHAAPAKRWTARRAVAAAALPAILALLPAAACRQVPERRPDLLLITIDTLRADRLACYGGPPDVGAAICEVANAGTRFVWAFATAPATGPSIASILTSRYEAGHGVSEFMGTHLAADARSVAELLSDADYATAAFVSNPVLHPSRRFGRGFDVYDYRMTRRERNRPTMREREAAATTDAALAWATVVRRPFFLWVHYQDPHGPYEPPDATPIRNDGEPQLAVLHDHSGWRGIPAYQALPDAFTPAAYERRYLEEIRYLDRHLARLLEGLDRLGTRPAVLLTADHGEAFGEDEFYFAHGHSVGLDQIRVPLLWRPAGGGAARVISAPVSTLDVAPTLLATAGLSIPERFEGIPLPVDGVKRPGAAGRVLFAEHPLRIAVIAGRSYYARDRQPFAAPVREPISGGLLPPLMPRTARLRSDGSGPRYEAATADGPAAALERVVEAFASAPEAGAATPVRLDRATREALAALGYLE